MIRDLQEDTTLLKPILIHNLWMPNRHVHITILICPTWSLWKLQTALTHVITCFVWREGFLLRRHEYLWRLEGPSIQIIFRVSVAFFSLNQLLLPCCSPPPLFTPPPKKPFLPSLILLSPTWNAGDPPDGCGAERVALRAEAVEAARSVIDARACAARPRPRKRARVERRAGARAVDVGHRHEARGAGTGVA